MAILIIIIIITIFTEPSNIITDLCVKAQDEVNAVKIYHDNSLSRGMCDLSLLLWDFSYRDISGHT